jgi:MOSC domain-containing protein YiiM
MTSKAKIVAISISEKKGISRQNIESAVLEKGHGIVGDIHFGSERQVSLLALESIEKMKEKGLNVKPGDFAENITTQGIDLSKLTPGMRLKIGKDVVLEITQIGKDCHERCSIYYQAGDCIMPREGIFARVLQSGTIKPGDYIVIQY